MDLNNVMLAIVNLIYSQDLPSLDIYQHTHLLVHDYPSWSTFGLHLVRGPKTSYIEVFNNQTIEVRPWSRRMEKSHLSWFHLIVHGANKLFNDAKQLSWLLSYSQPTKPLIEGILSKRKVRNHAVLGGGQGLKGCETKVNHSSTGNSKLQCWQLLVSYGALLGTHGQRTWWHGIPSWHGNLIKAPGHTAYTGMRMMYTPCSSALALKKFI